MMGVSALGRERPARDLERSDRAAGSGTAGAVFGAELRQAAYGEAVFLVQKGEFEPELPLCIGSCDPAAGREQAQRGVAGLRTLAQHALEATKLQ